MKGNGHGSHPSSLVCVSGLGEAGNGVEKGDFN